MFREGQWNGSPPLEKLGELYVGDAVPLLEDLVNSRIDANLTQLAQEALEEIRRVRGRQATDS